MPPVSDTNPRLAYRVFWQPKRGQDAADYEDAYRVSAGDARAPRVAIADGATESIFAGQWANILVNGLVEEDAIDPERFADRLSRWQSGWLDAIEARSQPLPWYAAHKVETGAFATMLGLALEPDGGWRALAVGDCCLFHVRNGTVESIWPIDDPDDFGNRPTLVPSRRGAAAPAPEMQTGPWTVGDRFLLATDATAAWLMRAGLALAEDLDATAFRERVRAARAAGTLRNDDMTLVDLRMLA